MVKTAADFFIADSCVGIGRVYVQRVTATDAIDFFAWCRGIAPGRSYISDGYAHAREFTVDGIATAMGR